MFGSGRYEPRNAGSARGRSSSRTCNFGKPDLLPKVSLSTSGPRLDPPMPSKQHVPEPRPPDILREILEVRDALQLLVDDFEPTQPIGFVRLGPQRSVGGPQSPDFALLAPILERSLDILVQFLRQLVAHRVELAAEHGAALFLHGSIKVVGGVGEQPRRRHRRALRSPLRSRSPARGSASITSLGAGDVLFEAGAQAGHDRGMRPSSPAGSC